MKYQIILINGGDYSNIDAPLMIEAKNFGSLQAEIRDAFDLQTLPDGENRKLRFKNVKKGALKYLPCLRYDDRLLWKISFKNFTVTP